MINIYWDILRYLLWVRIPEEVSPGDFDSGSLMKLQYKEVQNIGQNSVF